MKGKGTVGLFHLKISHVTHAPGLGLSPIKDIIRTLSKTWMEFVDYMVVMYGY